MLRYRAIGWSETDWQDLRCFLVLFVVNCLWRWVFSVKARERVSRGQDGTSPGIRQRTSPLPISTICSLIQLPNDIRHFIILPLCRPQTFIKGNDFFYKINKFIKKFTKKYKTKKKPGYENIWFLVGRSQKEISIKSILKNLKKKKLKYI